MEKRRNSNRGGDERRFTPRLSDVRVATELREIRLWVRGLAVFGLAISAFLVVQAFFYGPERLALSVLVAGVGTVLAVILLQYSRSIGFYLANESISSLVKSIESQLVFWRSFGILLGLAMLILIVISL